MDSNPPEPLAKPEGEEDLDQQVNNDVDDESFPVGMVGTLYNNMSLVVKIHFLGGVQPLTMLFPGDLSDWSYLVSARPHDLEADIFKYPHHGSSGVGVSKHLKDAIEDFPYPWFWLSSRQERWYRRWWPWHQRYDSLYRAIQMGHTSSNLLSQVVRPQTTLLFPYPRYKLPKESIIIPRLGQIYANREDNKPSSLSLKQNKPMPLVLQLGAEKGDVTNVTDSYF